MSRDDTRTTEAPLGGTSTPFAALAMYAFEPLLGAWEQLYEAVARGVDSAPERLRWDLDPHDTWLSPNLAVGMACGWPLVNALRERVLTIGTFAYTIDGSSSHTYRSVIIARTPASMIDLIGATAAINSGDSLSGSISLVSALPPEYDTWPGPIVATGSHVASIAAVCSGQADLASIDALTWAYLQRDAVHTLSGLFVVDRGPVVAHLPIITNAHAGEAKVAEWRAALAAAITEPALADARDTLLITGFFPLDASDYENSLDALRRERA
ncbi:MAG: PhnD/SsuA/transferrin family substrate-binding protein [Ilumatobacteraceae bacterium]